MKRSRQKPLCAPGRAIVLATLCLGAILPLGCADGGLAPLRAVTYPPGFQYLTRKELKSGMADFAREVDELDGILSRDGGADASDRAAVVEILERMRLQAGQLEGGMSSNHPGLHQDADRFTRDVDRALAAARREPPDYTWTARLTGGCTACHAPRHPGAA